MNLKRAEALKEKLKHPFWISVILNICLLTLNLIFFQARFESNDDSGMSFIIEGIYGEKTAYAVFINVIIGKILKILYTVIPIVKWYVIFQYATLFVSFVFLGYILFKQFEEKQGSILFFALLIPFTYECYIYLQFTKTSGVAVATGLLLIFYCLRKHEKKRYLIAGILLAILGSMIRFQSMLMVSLILFALGINVIICECKKQKFHIKKILISMKPHLFYFAITFFCIFALEGVNKQAYKNDEGWKYFLEYNYERYHLLDYGFPDWEENKAAYQKMGITKADIDMYQSWCFADFEMLSLDKMKQINKLRENKKITIHIVEDFVKDIPIRFLEMRYSILLIAFFTIYLLYCKRKKHSILCYVLLAFLGSYLYFFFMDRYININRIDFIYIYAIFCVLLELFGEGDILQKKGKEYAWLVLLTVGLFSVGDVALKEKQFMEQNAIALENKQQYQEFYRLTTEDKDKLYLQNTSSIFNDRAYSMWEVIPEGLSENRVSLGNWLTGSPLTLPILQKFDVENPFHDVINHSDVYLINNYGIDTELSYIQRHYEENAKGALVKNINGFSVYKIFTEVDEKYLNHQIKNSENIETATELTYSAEDKALYISGTAYKKNKDSFKNEYFIDIYNVSGKQHDVRPLTQFQSEYEDQYNGKYGRLDQIIDVSGLKQGTYELDLILHVDDENYVIQEESIQIK